MKTTLLSILLSLFIISCHQQTEKGNYAENPALSDKQGHPHDSLTFYFPTTIKKDSLEVKNEMNTFVLNWYSSALYAAKEPILFNYYLGHDMYRFLWLRSFDRPVVFTLHRDGREVWLTTKVLNKQPNFDDITYVSIGEMGDKELVTDSVVKADRKASLVINTSKKLSKKDWNNFTALLDKCSFWTTKPYSERGGFDGSEWIIEGHLKSKYWFVSKWSPKDNFRELGLFLINKSELKERVY